MSTAANIHAAHASGARMSVRSRGRRVLLAADAVATPLALLAALAVVGALYGRALGYTFLFDDTYDLTRAEGRGYWDLLTSANGYAYYRPLPFMLWKALRAIQGRYDAATLHALPLLAHALAGWLLFVLLRRLGAGYWAALPALLFLTYPFSYQDVAIVGTLFHPLAAAGMLASLVLYERGRAAGGHEAVAWHATALATTAVALWSHESGVTVAPLIVGLEALLLWRARSWRVSPWLAGHLALTALFVATWASVDRGPSNGQASLATLQPTALFFTQGFVYPISAQLRWLNDRTSYGFGILDAAALATLLVGSAYGAAAWRNRRWPLLAIPVAGLAIAVAAALPAAARLPYAYIENAPRLLYIGSIGAAVGWGLLPMLDFRQRWLTLAWRVVTLAALVAVMAQARRFVDVRMDMFARGAEAVRAVARAGEQYRGQRVLVVNAPAWLAQNRYEYLYGKLGVQVMPEYIGLDRVIYTSSERQARVDARSVSWNPDVSGGQYSFGPHGAAAAPEQLDAYLREGRELLVVTVRRAGFTLRDVGRLLPGEAERGADGPGRIGAGEGVRPSTARGVLTAAGLIIYINWNVNAPPGADADTVIELRDSAGAPVANWTGYALGGYSAPRLWQAGDKVADSAQFTAPPASVYTIWVGLQLVGSTERLPAYDANGTRAADDMLLVGQVVIP